jgi:hypothetical protein
MRVCYNSVIDCLNKLLKGVACNIECHDRLLF